MMSGYHLKSQLWQENKFYNKNFKLSKTEYINGRQFYVINLCIEIINTFCLQFMKIVLIILSSPMAAYDQLNNRNDHYILDCILGTTNEIVFQRIHVYSTHSLKTCLVNIRARQS